MIAPVNKKTATSCNDFIQMSLDMAAILAMMLKRKSD